MGESIYNILMSSGSISKSKFIELKLDRTRWKYLSRSDPQSMYRVYEYTGN